MSRTLSPAQKRELDKQLQAGIMDVESMDPSDFNRIDDLNPHETFWQNANRYMWDEIWSGKYDDQIRNYT